MQRLIALVLLAMLAACAATPSRPTPADDAALPFLRLPPSTLPGTLALEQRLVFRHGDRGDTVDALVENDATQTRLVIHAQGQVALRLTWDGQEIVQQRAPWLPPALEGERVLADLQLVFWPLPALQAALPAGWTLADEAGDRVLRHRDTIVASVEFPSDGEARLRQHVLGYTLDITSRPVAP